MGEAGAAPSPPLRGTASLHFHLDQLAVLDLAVTDVVESGERDGRLHPTEEPLWTFSVAVGSEFDLAGTTRARIDVNALSADLSHEGGFAIRDLATGDLLPFRPFQLACDAGSSELSLIGSDGAARLRLDHARILGSSPAHGHKTVRILDFDLRMTRSAALSLQRPDLEDALIGTGQWILDLESMDASEEISGLQTRADQDPSTLRTSISTTGCTTDGKLAELYQPATFGRIGSFPDGETSLALATTICNIGDCSIPWNAPMNEAHPGVAMQLYRLADGKFEQIGLSDVKHGYFPLGLDGCGNLCTDLPNDLGIGCQDTYGASSNADRLWLAPRDEWSGFLGTWECTGSHFAGGEPDCVRRHDSSGHDPVEHRLRVRDADLIDPTDSYFIEAMYIVAGDVDRFDNYGHRPITFVRTGDDYTFSVGSGFSATEGPALQAWGPELHWGTFPGEGNLLLGYSVTNIGGGQYQYEYALQNLDSDLGVKSFRVPIGSGALSGIGFHDPNGDELDDWTATVDGNELIWETETNPIRWGNLYNFRFVSPEPGVPGLISCASFVGASTATIEALVPGDVSSVPSTRVDFALEIRPNPTAHASRIEFSLPRTADVGLDVYDSAGRLVRRLVAGPLSAGVHRLVWDGTDDRGLDVGSGVYYCRLGADGEAAIRTVRRVR
ncbi:MAG: FlgD immunoglobulin-like domain containing protein [Candidatus Eisenbacteria bacterium]